MSQPLRTPDSTRTGSLPGFGTSPFINCVNAAGSTGPFKPIAAAPCPTQFEGASPPR
nr:hypothetical protein [Hyphomonas sp.]